MGYLLPGPWCVSPQTLGLNYLPAGYLHELSHGQFNKMTTGEQVGTAAAGIVAAGIMYEVLHGSRPCYVIHVPHSSLNGAGSGLHEGPGTSPEACAQEEHWPAVRAQVLCRPSRTGHCSISRPNGCSRIHGSDHMTR